MLLRRRQRATTRHRAAMFARRFTIKPASPFAFV
jgi:hypothetical protein